MGCGSDIHPLSAIVRRFFYIDPPFDLVYEVLHRGEEELRGRERAGRELLEAIEAQRRVTEPNEQVLGPAAEGTVTDGAPPAAGSAPAAGNGHGRLHGRL
jgi:hypothetical protein